MRYGIGISGWLHSNLQRVQRHIKVYTAEQHSSQVGHKPISNYAMHSLSLMCSDLYMLNEDDLWAISISVRATAQQHPYIVQEKGPDCHSSS